MACPQKVQSRAATGGGTTNLKLRDASGDDATVDGPAADMDFATKTSCKTLVERVECNGGGVASGSGVSIENRGKKGPDAMGIAANTTSIRNRLRRGDINIKRLDRARPPATTVDVSGR
uniref:Uncharacterized protein n=1 Tax=Odontella aurita TaxID=265563 RepID=A0A7S4MX34_9STRA|mmetsp:Transcript_37925/g.113314  ORF Transcript_37925/g.113314 Transcript_37925/m.113314 type:complete len:119 (+) Transcript_37925:495-851(+)